MALNIRVTGNLKTTSINRGYYRPPVAKMADVLALLPDDLLFEFFKNIGLRDTLAYGKTLGPRFKEFIEKSIGIKYTKVSPGTEYFNIVYKPDNGSVYGVHTLHSGEQSMFLDNLTRSNPNELKINLYPGHPRLGINPIPGKEDIPGVIKSNSVRFINENLGLFIHIPIITKYDLKSGEKVVWNGDVVGDDGESYFIDEFTEIFWDPETREYAVAIVSSSITNLKIFFFDEEFSRPHIRESRALSYRGQRILGLNGNKLYMRHDWKDSPVHLTPYAGVEKYYVEEYDLANVESRTVYLGEDVPLFMEFHQAYTLFIYYARGLGFKYVFNDLDGDLMSSHTLPNTVNPLIQLEDEDRSLYDHAEIIRPILVF